MTFSEDWLKIQQAKRAEEKAQVTASPSPTPAIQKKPRGPRNDYEHQEQVALIDMANAHQNLEPRLKWLFAIPNGGKRGKAEAGKLKAEGVKKGVADLLLPSPDPTTGAAGLFIEMKYDKNKPSPDQIEFLDDMRTVGYKVAVCWSMGAAWNAICEYLNRKDLSLNGDFRWATGGKGGFHGF